MSTDTQALVPVREAREKRPAARRAPRADTGSAALAQLRAEMLAALGVTEELLAETVSTQREALQATRAGEPDWQARLRAARDLQDLGIPRQHGNASASSSHVLHVEFPEWFRNLAESRRSRE